MLAAPAPRPEPAVKRAHVLQCMSHEHHGGNEYLGGTVLDLMLVVGFASPIVEARLLFCTPMGCLLGGSEALLALGT